MSCFRVLVIVFGHLITWVASQAVAQDATGTGSAAKPKPTDAVNIAPAAEAAPASVAGHPDFPDLTIPLNADVATLQNLVNKAKKAKPGSPEQYKAQQTAIKQASSKLMQTLDKLSPGYKQAEMDTIISSVALLTFFNDKDQSVVIKQVTDFLKGRKKLSIQDVQTGIMTAGMLELQPNKNPAREIYELINELLKDDDREEMQSLRLNMQAAVRRLNMLGSKFEFDAQTVDGQRITTADFAGKFVLVDMFATWCKPCMEERPLLKSHYEKYRDKGLAVISISLDGDRAELDKFLKENPLPWPVFHDGAENPLDRMQLKYGVSMLPTVLLLNKEGTVVSLEARNTELNRLMQMLFETPTPAAPEPAKAEAAPAAQSTIAPPTTAEGKANGK